MLLFVAGSGALTAQTPRDAALPPAFRTAVNFVTVDVAAVDRFGEPITTLAADDFTVEEDGAAQVIQSFKFVSADGELAPDRDLSLPIRSVEHGAAEAARDEVRVFVIFWDEYHISPGADTIKGRKTLATLVSTAFGPDDVVALMDPLLPTDGLRFTRDRRELLARIARLEGRSGVYSPTRSAAEDNVNGRPDIERVRSEVTTSALKSAAVHLGSIKDGRKSIILISDGLTGLGTRQSILIRDLAQAANASNTAIHTVRLSGSPGGHGALGTIAKNTGAAAFLNARTRESALHQVVRHAGTFYLLGYASTRNPNDGKYHKIRVTVKREGVELRARQGYWAPDGTALERAHIGTAARESTPADLTRALAALSSARPGQMLDLWVGAARGADREPTVTVSWTPRASAARGDPDRRVSVAITGAGGERSVDARFDAGTLSFSSQPGPVRLLLKVRDAAGDVLDDDRLTFEVPDPAAAPLALSLPMLLRARTAADARVIAGGGPALPFAGREFPRSDHLFLRFSVFGRSAADATVSAYLTNRSGAILLDLPITSVAGVEAVSQIQLPLASIARGDYVIAVAAVHAGEHIRALVPIRVTP
jgi:VWFA-related protein